MESFIISPVTGRQIKVGGPVYKSLQRDGFNLSKEKVIKKSGYTLAKKGDIFTGDYAKLAKMPSSPVRKLSGRGSQTRGWGAAAPKKGAERKRLQHKCGDSCFLRPDVLGFPICSRCGEDEDECSCELNCSGLAAAKIRAHQWKYTKVAEVADRLYKERCK